MTTLVLTAADRCDRCGAGAYVVVSVFVPDSGDRELMFCAHASADLHHMRRLGASCDFCARQPTLSE